ncbi:MAG: response regulator transcription factor [Bacteroidota bacterium]
MNNIKNILIVEDHRIVSRGLQYLITLNFQSCVVSEVVSLEKMQLVLPAGSFTHLILDLALGDCNAMEVLPDVIEQYPQLKVLVYSMAQEGVYGRKILQAGTSGFLSKSADEKEILRALKIFLVGGVYMSEALKSLGSGESRNTDYKAFLKLSVNELRVLGLILKGNNTKAIAGQLNVRSQTIGTYKARIFTKLGTNNLFNIQKLADLYNII